MLFNESFLNGCLLRMPPQFLSHTLFGLEIPQGAAWHHLLLMEVSFWSDSVWVMK